MGGKQQQDGKTADEYRKEVRKQIESSAETANETTLKSEIQEALRRDRCEKISERRCGRTEKADDRLLYTDGRIIWN